MEMLQKSKGRLSLGGGFSMDDVRSSYEVNEPETMATTLRPQTARACGLA